MSVTTADESAEWVAALSAHGPASDAATTRLHGILLGVARAELHRRSGGLGVSGPELDDLAYQAAADAVLAITAKIGQFRGESKFSTWAYRFVVLEVSSKVARHFWQRTTVSLDAENWAALPDRLGLQPAQESEWRDLMAALRTAIEQELTEHQRRVFVALVLNAVPLDVLALELHTTRNALYKSLFDARHKVRAALAAAGYLSRDDRRVR